MSPADRPLAALVWVLGVLAVAGITHIVAIFAMPAFAGNNPYERVLELTKPAQLAILPPVRADNQFIPFTDPAMMQAVCPFDLSQGGLRLHADGEGDRLLMLSFRTRTGRVFYSMTDLASQNGKMDILVLTAAQLETVESEDDEDNPSQNLRLVAPETQGFVIISSLASYPGDRVDAEERLKLVTCRLEQIAQD
jgi:uncharacterized membrane protein